ncbi:MAG: hypothetical protein ACXVPU_02135 [Bacteroidia bacterium]
MKLLLYLLFVPGVLFLSRKDCNTDIICVKQTLLAKKWVFQETKGGAWSGSCGHSSDLMAEFNPNGKLNVMIETTRPCEHPKIIDTVLYSTTYKIISEKFDQIFIRVNRMCPRFGMFEVFEVKNIQMSDSLDFQFLYNDKTKKLILRNNSLIKENASIENTFQ